MKDKPVRVDFDDYADQYEGLLQAQLGFFSQDRGYFSDYKVRVVKDHLEATPQDVLDFGCGIGLSLPFLKEHFPQATISATDLSAKSLEYVGKNLPFVQVLRDDQLEGKEFDLIFVSGVFHHIPVSERPLVTARLRKLLSPHGRLFVFEHNPYNPVTRRMVSTCPFDEDAVLLTQSEMKRLFRDAAGLKIAHNGYCLFFPEKLKRMRPMERALRWLPMGGQYFVAGTR